jgi:hypothetical protein
MTGVGVKLFFFFSRQSPEFFLFSLFELSKGRVAIFLLNFIISFIASHLSEDGGFDSLIDALGFR